MCNIAAHFIGHQEYVQTILLILQHIIGAYEGNQIVEIIVEVILKFGFSKRLGIYIGDNTNLNNIT